MLHIKTIMLIIALVALVGSACIFYMHWRKMPANGLPLWSCGFLSLFLGLGLMGCRGPVPEIYSIVGGNAFLILSFIINYQAVCAFTGEKGLNNRQKNALVIAFFWTLAVLYYFSAMTDIFMVRMGLTETFLITASFASGYKLLQKRTGAATKFTAIVFFLFSFLSAVFTAGLLLFHHSQPSFESAGYLWTTMVACLMAFPVLLLVGVVMMTNEKLIQKLEEQALLDPLTGIGNRRSLFFHAEQAMGRLNRLKESAAVLLVDIDHFKAVNDTYGHIIGDDVLKHFVHTLQKEMRDIDQIFRFGGEEFIILLQPCSLEAARFAAERFRRKVQGTPYTDAHCNINLTTSIGIAPLQCGTANLLHPLNHADQALYEAKEKGRNQVMIWDDTMEQSNEYKAVANSHQKYDSQPL